MPSTILNMKNKIDEMLSTYGLSEESSILPMLDNFLDEEEIREYCWRVLNTYPRFKKRRLDYWN
ncbi:hypothetical protein SAMN04488101_11474 [Pedobacter nyackensis]|uniref:Uncharacterized protein n=2 Tax=Pedobacter nyackensis TaxID=475255 RepID=A0A1W2EPU4_9SPHI|nr:hypothetical protein SAMN04488101_11474 [Pedobacter nyackensis]